MTPKPQANTLADILWEVKERDLLISEAEQQIEALITEARTEQKIDTLKTTHGHQETGTILNDKYFIHNITMLEKELEYNK